MPDHLAGQTVENAHGQQGEPDHQQAGNRTTVERHPKRCCPRAIRGGFGRPRIRQNGDTHTNITSSQGTKCTDDEANGGRMIFEEKEKQENDRRNHAYGNDLPI